MSQEILVIEKVASTGWKITGAIVLLVGGYLTLLEILERRRIAKQNDRMDKKSNRTTRKKP